MQTVKDPPPPRLRVGAETPMERDPSLEAAVVPVLNVSHRVRRRAAHSGEGGIRTLEAGKTRPRDFQSRSLSHSDTSPCRAKGSPSGRAKPARLRPYASSSVSVHTSRAASARVLTA